MGNGQHALPVRVDLIGRGERIRTSDLTVPNRALYQAEPRPDRKLKASGY